MTVEHTGLETACYAAEKEAEGRPEWFKHHGYLATEKDKMRYIVARAKEVRKKRALIPEEHKAGIAAAAESMRKALDIEDQPEVFFYVLNALTALEKALKK